MITVTVIFDGDPVGFGTCEIELGQQNLQRVDQIGGPSMLVAGRRERDTVELYLDPQHQTRGTG